MRYSSRLAMLLVVIVCTNVSVPSFAQPNETYTLNVIGFQKIVAPSSSEGGGMLLASMPFYEQDTPNLNNVLGTSGPSDWFDLDAANNVYMTQALITYWLSDRYDSKVQWVNSSGPVTNVFIDPGMGFWYLNRATDPLTIYLAGDVVDDPVITNVIVKGYQLVSYPFSKPIRMTDLTLTNGVVDWFDVDAADNIILYRNNGFITYWFSDQYDSKAQWVNLSGPATNVFILPGEGFWYVSRVDGSYPWVEVRPYTL
jgi:hypothetical protein